MKFTLSWLKSHLKTDAPLDVICEVLTDLGLEVENISNPAQRLSDFRIGYVRDAQPHPDADRLRVCQVQTDAGELQIICGAPNARAGIYVVVAQPGSYVPGIDTTIGVGKIRGVESHGMMCSEREMELSDEHDGIIELLGKPDVGSDFVDYLAQHNPAKVDPVIEIAITPNRPDALGVRGIARDLAARDVGELIARDLPAPIEGGFQSSIGVRIADDSRDGCPVFFGRMIRGVKNGASPQWLQDYLRAIGLRPISFLVDVTNFFTYDRNRPLHVFDADKVTGDLLVRRAKVGETVRALDEKNYTLDAGMMVISDDSGAESIAGVMGGLHTGCTPETVNVFVESAYWDPIQIAKTGRKLKINSDARYRFERGVDPAFCETGLDHAVRMILEYAGGEASELLVAGQAPDTRRSYDFDPKRIESLVGMELPRDQQVQILTDLGFVLQGDQAHVPSWRPDVLGSADLVEEVARIASLSKLDAKPLPMPNVGVPKPILTPMQRRETIVRRKLAALGYNECVTYSFIDHASAMRFGGGDDAVMLANPISSEMSHMRPSLLPGLLQAAGRNQARGMLDLALFEVGPVFHGGEPEDQELLATGLLIGHTGGRDPFGARRPIDTFDAKADAQAVLGAIGAPSKLMVQRGAREWWHPQRSGKLSLGPKTILAAFGELHPKVLAAYDIKGSAVAFAIHLGNLPLSKRKMTTRAALSISDFQPVERDFAFVVDAQVGAADLLAAARGADKTLITDALVFDVFDGEQAIKQLGVGKKSIALSIRLEPNESTLTDAQIETVCAKVIDKVTKATGAVLRQ